MSKRLVDKGRISVHTKHSVVDSARKGKAEIIVEDGEIKGKIMADPCDPWVDKRSGKRSPESRNLFVSVQQKIIGSIDWNDVDIPCLADEESEADTV
jgi:hypothetical protein